MGGNSLIKVGASFLMLGSLESIFTGTRMGMVSSQVRGAALSGLERGVALSGSVRGEASSAKPLYFKA